MNIEKIYIVTDAPFPIGMAPTNRILSYTEGFAGNEKHSEVIIFNKTERSGSILNFETTGVIGSSTYRYLASSTIKSSNFFGRRLDKFIMPLRLFAYSINKFSRNTPVIYYSISDYPAILLKISALIKKFPYLREESEHPGIYTSTLLNFQNRFTQNLHYRLFDALILMTRNLIDYFEKELPSKPKVHIPMTVNLKRFDFHKNGLHAKTIVYTGMLNDRKDGVNYLIKAFRRIAMEFSDFKLFLVGAPANLNLEMSYREMVERFNLQDKVVFMGKVPNHIVPELLVNASILVLPRPNSKQAMHGFPTKLGEYLATGNPVVVTSVGEIPQYLKDGESAFIAEPDDEDSLYNKIREAIQNYERAKQIGQKGKEVAEKSFNNINQTRQLIDFIESNF